jgi:hypothetical protein
MKCLRPPKDWDRGYETHSKHGCLYGLVLCLSCPVYVATLRWADPPSKDSDQLSVWSIISEVILSENTPESLIRQGRRRIFLQGFIFHIRRRICYAMRPYFALNKDLMQEVREGFKFGGGGVP